jgi:hypothetical protein
MPEVSREHGVAVAHYRTRDAMELRDVVEEEVGDGCCYIRVAERQEVAVLGEFVDHSEDH